jgi:enediyne biosynthesis protein E5
MPMTSAAFIIFTLYMIPDPATPPLKPARQTLFGLSVALVYGMIQLLHLVFGLFSKSAPGTVDSRRSPRPK